MTPDAVRAAVEECKRLAVAFGDAVACDVDIGTAHEIAYREALFAAIDALASLHAPDAVSPVVLPAELSVHPITPLRQGDLKDGEASS